MLADQCKKLCDSGVCKSICCGVVPFEVELFNKYAYRSSNHKWTELKLAEDKKGTKFVIAPTKDLSCIFKNDQGGCDIYDERPEVCRKFGGESHPLLRCPYIDKNGKLRSKKETKKILEDKNAST